LKVKPRRVGIYAGAFDPVHAGHIAFALQAIDAAKLDVVYFIPERLPRQKPQVTHYAHRVAMIRRALRPYQTMDVLELEDRSFTVYRTQSRLERKFKSAQFVMLCGTDVIAHMPSWPHVGRLLNRFELCIGIREGESTASAERMLAKLPAAPLAVTTVKSYAGAVSSTKMRDALRLNRGAKGLLQSVVAYAKQEWLYV